MKLAIDRDDDGEFFFYLVGSDKRKYRRFTLSHGYDFTAVREKALDEIEKLRDVLYTRLTF